MSRGKSTKMRAIEQQYGRELEDLLPDLVNEHGQAGTADLLGITLATLGYWLRRCNIAVQRVAVRPEMDESRKFGRTPSAAQSEVSAISRLAAPVREKSLKMEEIEVRFDQELEVLLPDLVNEHGQGAAAKLLGVSRATIGMWLMRFGIKVHSVALRPGERIEIVPQEQD